MNKISDEAILEQLRSVNLAIRNKALSSLYKENFHGVAQFVRKNSGKEEDAEDIFQDCLIVFYGKVVEGNLQLTSPIQAYLFSIARNLWLKKLRAAGKELKGKSNQKETPVEIDSLELIIKNERNSMVSNLLAKLGTNCKKVLLLFYFEQLSMKEIMDQMGWKTIQSAKNKKSLCMKKLKVLVNENPSFRAMLKG